MEEIKKKAASPRVRRVRARAVEAPVSNRRSAPRKLKLLITVVNREKAEFYTDLLQACEVNMQISAFARGTATSDILHMMGLEDSEKSVIFSVIREDKAPEALRMLEEKFNTIKRGKGIAYTVPLSGMIGVSLYQFFCNDRRAVKEEK
ncbi:MAG: hypothetical protein IJY43_01220 [Clostridia bacterium]|nr:hypothetical protein [Clostridia bacterium]